MATMRAPELAPMATWLACDDPHIRQGANTTLGRMGISPALRAEAVASQLLHPNLSVRTRAAGALREMGAHAAEPHVAELAAQFVHRDGARRVAALEALGNLRDVGGSQTAAVVANLWDGDAQVRVAAAKTLAKLGKNALPHIEAITLQYKHRDVQAREQIAETLGDIGEHLPEEPDTEAVGEAVANTLCFLAQDHCEAVRQKAGRSLARLGSLAVPRLVKLQAAFHSFEADQCRAAVEVFVNLGAASAPFGEAIYPLVFHKDASVRRMAAKALGGMGSEAHWLAEELGVQMELGPLERQRLACAALSRMGDIGAEVLQVKAVHTDGVVRKSAQLALDEMRAAAGAWH